MSIETLTGDEFMRLEAEDHRVALEMYEAAIDATVKEVERLNEGGGVPAREKALDRLTSQLQLRKLHRVRLEELVGDEQPEVAADEQSKETFSRPEAALA